MKYQLEKNFCIVLTMWRNQRGRRPSVDARCGRPPCNGHAILTYF